MKEIQEEKKYNSMENGIDQEQYHDTMFFLKDEINSFLWTRLPAKITLEEAEKIAVKMHEMINNAWMD